MKTQQTKWLVLAGVFGLACGTDEQAVRGGGGRGGQVGQAAGSGGSLASAGSGGSAGSPASGGAGGAPASNLRLGEPLALVAGTGDLPYAIGPNPYGIQGGGFLARAPMGNTITVGTDPGQICISGTLAEVPQGTAGANYGQYWGVEFGFNLNQQPAGGAPPPPPAAPDAGSAAADAGADAGDAGATPPADVAQPWQLGNVIGFSYVIEGSPINFIRFKALPVGYDRSLEESVFCKELPAAESGAVQTALFSEIDQYCWGANFNLALPTAGGLNNIAWQLPADVAPAGERPFDWCLKDLRPILAQ